MIDLGSGQLLCAFFSSNSSWSADRNTWIGRDINVVRSTDGGITWSQTPTVIIANSSSADFWPALVKSNTGKVICAFTTSDQGNSYQLNIEMLSSTDNGLAWWDQQMISVQAHSESWPALVLEPDGSILAVWDSDNGEASSTYYLYSSRLAIP